MSMDFQSETIILSSTSDFEELSSTYSGTITYADYKVLCERLESLKFVPSLPTENLITRVSGKSRGAWQAYVTKELCEMANIHGIEFLYCSGDVPADWNFQNDGDLTDEHAYLLTESKIAAAISAIDQIFAWSKEHIDELSELEPIAYCVGKEELEENIDSAVVKSKPAFGWDGDDPQYLFSYLASVREILRNALSHKKDVLHTAMVAC